MKNSDKILLLIGIVVIIGGLFIYSTKGNSKLECTLPDDTAGVNEVDYKEYECLLKNDTINIVYVGSANCGYCTQYKPILDGVANDYNIPVYYVDIASLSEANYNKLLTSISYFSEQSKWGTPTTFVLKGNKVLDVLGGLTAEDALIDWFKENNIISGE